MPETPENSASLKLILSSVLEDWHNSRAELASANDVYQWIMQQLTGGHNVEATVLWRTEVKTGMLPGETLAHYYRRMCNLSKCLRRKGHSILDREDAVVIASGLPQEAKEPEIFH